MLTVKVYAFPFNPKKISGREKLIEKVNRGTRNHHYWSIIGVLLEYYWRPPFIGNIRDVSLETLQIFVGDTHIFNEDPHMLVGDAKILVGNPQIFIRE